jgi:hypothetical protein
MFDENFSFLSSTTSPSSCPSNDTAPSSPGVSPFSSRCSSPIPRPAEPTFTSLTFRQRDNRYDSRPIFTNTHVPRHPSITALTAEFDSQVLHTSSDFAASSSSYFTNSNSNTDLEDLEEGPTENVHHYTSHTSDDVFDPSLWDLSLSNLNTTSYPTTSPPAFGMRRRQRQAFVRLQCLARRAPDLAMLMEECHPSSLPLIDRGRAKSISGGTGRIEKERSSCVNVAKRLPRIRKRVTR